MNTKESLISAVNSEDDLGKVIRAHIVIESLLNQIIELNVKDISFLNKVDLTYMQKVNLSLALGYNKNWASALQSIATIRNGFAHKPRGVLNKSDVNNLYKSFHSSEKETLQALYKKQEAGLKTVGYKSFGTLLPEQKFTLCVTMMCAALEAFINVLAGKPKNV